MKKKHKIKQNKINFYKKSKYIYSEILEGADRQLESGH